MELFDALGIAFWVGFIAWDLYLVVKYGKIGLRKLINWHRKMRWQSKENYSKHVKSEYRELSV